MSASGTLLYLTRELAARSISEVIPRRDERRADEDWTFVQGQGGGCTS